MRPMLASAPVSGGRFIGIVTPTAARFHDINVLLMIAISMELV